MFLDTRYWSEGRFAAFPRRGARIATVSGSADQVTAAKTHLVEASLVWLETHR